MIDLPFVAFVAIALAILAWPVWSLVRTFFPGYESPPNDWAAVEPLPFRPKPATIPTDYLDMTPEQFEHAIGDLLEQEGYRNVQYTGGPGDRGVDLRCRDATGRLIVVQCKRYEPFRAVGSPDMQRLLGAWTDQHANGAIFATTGSFTSDARKYAQDHRIRLIDGDHLAGRHVATRVSQSAGTGY